MPTENTCLDPVTITDLQRLDFEAGAYFSSRLELKIDQSILHFQRWPFSTDLTGDTTRTLSSDEMEALIRVLNEVKVLKWKANYKDHQGILDGFSWSLTLVYNQGKRKKTEGYVNTPENFEQLEEYLEKLAGSTSI